MNILEFKVNVIQDNNIIDRKENEIQTSEKDLKEYILEIAEKTMNGKTSRYFKFNENNKVESKIKDFIQDKNMNDQTLEVACTSLEDRSSIWEDTTKEILKLLLEAEKESNKKTSNMEKSKKVKKGSLIQALIQNDGGWIFVLAKVEHSEFIDEDDYRKKMGLPVEKQIIKTSTIILNEKLEVQEVIVLDSTQNSYWTRNFLDIEPMNTDIANTKKSFSYISRFLSTELKNSSPADYTHIYNKVLAYYEVNSIFNIDKFIKIFNEHESNHLDEAKMKVIGKKFNDNFLKWSNSREFDGSFKIDRLGIKSKEPKKYIIHDRITLKITGAITNFKDIIKGKTDKETGEKYLKIKVSNSLYNEFNFEE
ncbi:MAG: hypothetical protein ACRCWG_17285 [Sarcina sp.]